VNEIDADQIPTVIQYNKRDLPNALPVGVLNEKMNPKGWPHFEACAKQGTGVEETLKGVTGLVFRSLAAKYGGAEAAAAAAASRAALKPAPAAARPAPPLQHKPAAPPARRAATPLSGGSADELLDSLELGALEPAPSLDDITQPGGEELSLDAEPSLPPAPEQYAAPDTAPDLAPFQELSAPESNLELDLEDLGVEEPAPVAVAVRAPAPPPARAAAPAPRAAPAAPPPRPSPAASGPAEIPISVQLNAAPGVAEVVIPVEITLAEGTARVTLNLRLTLNLKLPR
jgi:hypothetical protein